MKFLDRLLRRSAEPIILGGDTLLEVVGESFYQENLLRIVGGRSPGGANFPVVAVLEAEPTNRYDSNAVAVKVDGVRVGSLPGRIAATYQKHVIRLTAHHGQPIALRGVIGGGWDRGGCDMGSFGISLHHDPSDFSG
jgi:hypothetical protein